MLDTQKTKWLMSASAIYIGLIGIGASFFPEEILTILGAPSDGFTTMTIKVIGALYIGLAMLNWTARGNIIGGIYSRPVAICNFAHFFIVAIIMLKQWSVPSYAVAFWIATLINIFFTSVFGYLLFFRGSNMNS